MSINHHLPRSLKEAKKNQFPFMEKQKLLAENYIVYHLNKSNIRYCIGRIFSTSNKDQKKKVFSPRFKKED